MGDIAMKYGIKLMAWFCLLFLMVLSVVGVIGWGRKDHHTIEKHTPQRSSVDTSAAWEKIEPHLAASDEATKKALFNACNRVDQFFAEKRSRVRSFAEEALSLRSKWRLVKGKLPGTDSEGHMHFLRERFEALVFSSKELAEVIRAATEEYVENLRGIENELLIK